MSRQAKCDYKKSIPISTMSSATVSIKCSFGTSCLRTRWSEIDSSAAKATKATIAQTLMLDKNSMDKYLFFLWDWYTIWSVNGTKCKKSSLLHELFRFTILSFETCISVPSAPAEFFTYLNVESFHVHWLILHRRTFLDSFYFSFLFPQPGLSHWSGNGLIFQQNLLHVSILLTLCSPSV